MTSATSEVTTPAATRSRPARRRRRSTSLSLFPETEWPLYRESTSGSFVDNVDLPVHRWFRYSAGFSGAWAEDLISREAEARDVRVFDPFAGGGTTLIAAEQCGVESWGIDSHPFVARVARAKLAYRSSPDEYLDRAKRALADARRTTPAVGSYLAGFRSFTFEKTRDRNIKWKNRKHRVPLYEGRLWVEG